MNTQPENLPETTAIKVHTRQGDTIAHFEVSTRMALAFLDKVKGFLAETPQHTVNLLQHVSGDMLVVDLNLNELPHSRNSFETLFRQGGDSNERGP